MKNAVTINVPEINLSAVSDIEVTFTQKSSGIELDYDGDAIEVLNDHQLAVIIPKEDAMQLDDKSVRGQVMFTPSTGIPDATKIFTVTVDELLKEAGYGD
jgi:hypothetical protein